ncbi:MAG: hypothetical protein ABIN41_11485 [Devosia sp.]
MAWLLLLLIPVFGLPVLRLVLVPAPRRAGLPWPLIAIGLLVLGGLWFGLGQPRDRAPSYAEADSAMRALIE